MEMKRITQEELNNLIRAYEQWLDNGEIGKRPVFSNLDLSNLSFRRADLYKALFENSNLRGCNFRRANLERVSFRNANLENASLKEANLFQANLNGAILDRIKVNEQTKFFHPICPDEGSIIGYKKVSVNDRMWAIAKLLIPTDAKRNSATTYRCRASKAVILEIEREDGRLLDKAYSNRNNEFVYKVNQTVSVDDFDENRWHEASTGIHFFLSKEIAKLY